MATTTIPNLPNGGSLNPSDLLIYEDTVNNITKKSTSSSLWYTSKSINLTPDAGLSLSNTDGSPVTLTFNVRKIAPHLGVASRNSRTQIQVHNNTSSSLPLYLKGFPTDAFGHGTLINYSGIDLITQQSAISFVTPAVFDGNLQFIQTTPTTKTTMSYSVSVPQNSYVTILPNCVIFFYTDTDFTL